MSVPGVNVIVAASFLAAIGDIHRFKNPRKLVGYLGLDPTVRQSGPGPATHGHISKAGLRVRRATRWSRRAGARCASPVRCTRSIERIRARRGHQSRSSPPPASSRACSGACSRASEDYAYAQPSLTKKKLRRLEITAGAPHIPQGRRHLVDQQRDAPSRARARRPGRARLRNTVRDWHAAQAKDGGKVGASATPGRASNKPSKGKAARQTTSP